MTLPEFTILDKDFPCPKCWTKAGSDAKNFFVIWHPSAGGVGCPPKCTTECVKIGHRGEHMSFQCKRCRFTWVTKAADE